MKEVKPIPAKDISAEVLDLLRHIRDQVDKLCSLPPEVLGSPGQVIIDVKDYSGSANGIKVMDESEPIGFVDLTHELKDAITATEEFKDKKVSEIKELFDESGTISDAKTSKSISKRIVAQKPKKVIKTVEDIPEWVGGHSKEQQVGKKGGKK